VTASRADAARALAAAKGWTWHEGSAADLNFWALGGLPKPNADLSTHLSFVGRVAEALGDCDRVNYLGSRNRFHVLGCTGALWWVKFYDRDGRVGAEFTASDLSWAALLAAVAALEGR